MVMWIPTRLMNRGGPISQVTIIMKMGTQSYRALGKLRDTYLNIIIKYYVDIQFSVVIYYYSCRAFTFSKV